MRIHRRWQIALPLLLGAVLAVPANAQQPEPAGGYHGADSGKASAGQKARKAQNHARQTGRGSTRKARQAREAHRRSAGKTRGAAPAKPATPPNVGGVKPTLLGQYGEWGAYTASPAGKKVCFAIAKPTSSQTNPPDRPRNPTYMFISSRPAEKVSNEVSIIIGYPFKPGTEASAAVGSTTYALYTQQDGAWIKNAAEEAQMVDAMRAGQSAVVKGVSAKGTQSTDTFSLKGLSQALDRIGQECK